MSLRVCSQGPGKLGATASKPRHVGAQLSLWSGDGIPDKASYAIELRRAERASAVLTRLGRPVANCEEVVSIDLRGWAIKYGVLSTDGLGRVDLEQLVVGQKYAVQATTPQGTHHGFFTWNPGITIELK